MSDTYKNTPWDEWKLITSQILGKGTYGVVYKAININSKQYAAIKIIPVSKDKIDRAEKEIEILYRLKERNCPNILNIEDHKIMPFKNKYYIYIRTALLTSIKDRFLNYNELEINKLGTDICNALRVCEVENIIHRDIKPGNILYDEVNNNYILCDFGVAREIYEPDDTLTRVGAVGYVAPEVYSGKYDKRADIYSLGLVLYYFANNMNLPNDFPCPPPCNASKHLAETILKACDYLPNNRHKCAEELLYDIINSEKYFLSSKNRLVDPEKNTDNEDTKECDDQPPLRPIKRKPEPTPKIQYFLIGFLILILIILLIFLLKACNSSKSLKDKSSHKNTISDESTVSSPDEKLNDDTFESSNNNSADLISSIIDEYESLLKEQKYEEAFDRIQEGIENFPESEQLQKVKESINKKISIVHNNETALISAKEMAEQGNLISAIRLLEDTKNTSESGDVYDDNLSKAINDYTVKYVDDTLSKVDEYVNANDFSAAMDVLTEATKQLPNNSTLSSEMSSIKSQKEKSELLEKKDQLLKDAEVILNSQGYEEAIKVLQSVPELSSDSDIKAKITEYQSYKPDNLLNFTVTNQNNVNINTAITDPRDKSYSDVLELKGYHSGSALINMFDPEKAFVEFFVDGKYNNFSCSIVPTTAFSREDDVYAIIRVFADDNLVFTSEKITYKTEMMNISCQINNCKYLKIQLYNPEQDRTYEPATIDCGIIDTKISK